MIIICRDYKNFNNEYFQNDLKNELSKCPKNYESFENVFVTVLNRQDFTRKSKTSCEKKISVNQL